MLARPLFLASILVFSLVSPPISRGADKPSAGSRASARKSKTARKPAVPATAWEAMRERNVAVTLLDGSMSSGRLVGLKGRVATLIDPDGVVRTLDIAEVAELREARPAPPAPPAPPPPPTVRPPPPPPPPASKAKKSSRRVEREQLAALHRAHGDHYTGKKGTAMNVTGIVMSTFGVLAIIMGGAGFGLGLSRDDADDASQPGLIPAGKGLLVLGLVSFGVGLPLMIVGERRRDRYHAWLRRQPLPQASGRGRVVLSPTLGPLRDGWTAGLRIAF